MRGCASATFTGIKRPVIAERPILRVLRIIGLTPQDPKDSPGRDRAAPLFATVFCLPGTFNSHAVVSRDTANGGRASYPLRAGILGPVAPMGTLERDALMECRERSRREAQ